MFDQEEVLVEGPEVFTFTEADLPAFLSVDPETYAMRLTYKLDEEDVIPLVKYIEQTDELMRPGGSRDTAVLQITMPLRNVILGEIIDNDTSDSPHYMSIPLDNKLVVDALKSELMCFIAELNMISYT